MQDYKNTLLENIPYLRRYARALIDDRILADRMVQQCIDCATDLHQLIRTGQNNSVDQKIWLFSIFHNIYSEFTAEQQTMAAELSINASPYLPDIEIPNAPENDEFHRAFKQLPLRQKQVFLLVSVEKFLYEEVGKIVNQPLGAILSLLHTARNFIAEQVYRDSAQRTAELPENTDKNESNSAEEAVEMSL